jgi:hypothetical protein
MKNFFKKWLAFLFPSKGWKQKVIDFRQGKKAWGIEGKPECNPVIPFPLDWVPHTLELKHPEKEEDQKRGFDFLEVTCIDTGLEAKGGIALCCARCGVSIHPDSVGHAGFDVPACRRCRVLVHMAV